ncbi:MAG: acyltransferase family protein [Clostridia bacterium]|nr:acyltransferase family protein [Clostridia bacterium]
MDPQTSPLYAAKKRHDWLDAIKALAISLVIFGHLSESGLYPYAVYSSTIKLPLFFAASGFVFSVKKTNNAKQFFYNIIVRLIIPYFCISVSICALDIPLAVIYDKYEPSFIVDNLRSIVTGQTLWFVPVLFCCETIMFFLVRLFKKNDVAILLVSVIFIVSGYFFQTKTKIPWNPNVTVIAFPIFALGYFIRKYIIDLPQKKKLAVAAVGGAVYLILPELMHALTGKWYYLNMLDSVYINYPVNMFQIYGGTLAIFIFASYMTFPRFVSALGRNTLYYYGYHLIAAKYIILLLQYKITPLLTMDLLRSTDQLRSYFRLITIFVMLLLAPLAWITNRMLPFFTGKRYREIIPIWKMKKK